MRIIQYPDPRLRKRCPAVTRFDDELAALAARMLELMKAAPGVGLAAPQVGVLQRFFVMNLTGKAEDDQVIVNPEIEPLDTGEPAEEGCLSLPEIYVSVRRATRCRLRAMTVTGEPIDREIEGLEARVWQHETDHLDGRLIIDKMSPTERIANKRLLKDLEDKFGRGK